MFDDLKCEYPLPGNPPHLNFQTKDFQCEMDSFTITKEGRLVEHTTRTEATPEEEMEYYGTPEWDTLPWAKVMGMFRKIPTGDKDWKFHGYVNFYTSGPDDSWWEYDAKFTDGQLVSVERVNENGRFD